MNLTMWREHGAKAVALGVIYAALAAASVTLTRFDGGVAFIWLASAVLLAQLLVTPRGAWPPYLATCTIACSFATARYGLGPLAAPTMTIANMLEVVTTALLVRRWLGSGGFLDSIPATVRFVIAAGIVGPLLASPIAAIAPSLITGRDYARICLDWYLGHALGLITFTPLVLLAVCGEVGAWVRGAGARQRIEAIGLLVGTALVSVAVFGQERMPLLFLPMLPLVVTTFRLGRLGAAASLVIVAAIGSTLTMLNHGPLQLIATGVGGRIQFLQIYLATAVLLVLPVAAELKQRSILFRKLQESEALYRLLAEEATDVIVHLTVDGTIAYASPAVAELSGFDPADVIGRRYDAFIADADRALVAEANERAFGAPGTTVITEYRGLAKNGALVWCEGHSRAFVDEKGVATGAVSIVRAIGHHKSLEDRLAHDANTDPLTGLANRRLFEAALADAVRDAAAGRPASCLAVLDIDYFKSVNDRYGHAAGDIVLKAIAALTRATVRDGDIVGRLGGEEFALLLRNAGPEEARLICERLRLALGDTRTRIGIDTVVTVTTSVGTAAVDGSTTPTDVLRRADAALYEAKAAGRNCLRQVA